MVNRYVIGRKKGATRALIRRLRLPFVIRGFPSSFRRKPESRGWQGWHQPHPNTSNDQVSFSYLGVPAPAGMSDWYENAPTRLSSAPLNPSIPRSRHSGPSIRHSREGGNPGEAYGWQMTRTQLLQSAPRFSYLGVPAPAGISDCYESMSQTPIRDRPFQQPLIGHSRHPLVTPAPRFVIPAIESMPRTPIRGRNPEGWGEGIVALGLVPSLGRAARSRTLHRPAYHHFHPLMRPSQGHGDSGESTSRTPIRGRNPEGQGKGKTAQRRGKT